MNDLTIVIDTREQRPFTFESVSPRPETLISTLKTGDYSILGYEDRICIERKSLADLFGSCGKGRARFENEIVRMAEFEYAAIVAECDWQSILRCPPRRSQLLPKTILASVIAWEQRFGIHFWACPNRAFAEKLTYRILERYYRDQTCKPKNIKGNGVSICQTEIGTR
jgi:DNA excision repair protein ERCC-4